MVCVVSRVSSVVNIVLTLRRYRGVVHCQLRQSQLVAARAITLY